MTDENDPPYYMAAQAPMTREYLIHELRLMVEARGGYSRFKYMSPWVRDIWSNAAVMLAGDAPKEKGERHDG